MPDSYLDHFLDSLSQVVTGPVVWFHDKVATPYRKNYPWYHRQYRRVPGIENCYTDDWVCREEANAQFRRDKLVEKYIVQLLASRFETCSIEEGFEGKKAKTDPNAKCHDLWKNWCNANLNFYIKYGDMKHNFKAEEALMKQKHRMIWERRNGPIEDNGEQYLTN
ncbi:NADH dehydrogenase [ubiquinone] 1 beta subcomplex subunit 10 [Lepeophtheirus salmonis]|uniref:NADH dehydrogenase [ubiquinone] 1 beta subcomplex subunit 10 n=1 Tax=Lepeophtheirus salmonis TaxID=72036 RepID=C1BVP8_LEPSM|nr:NADH dehydrogenase [ubiquinone] 1 beta subcomplex subunit 10-like [Lepeophtheirus salmonis]ACO13101.1 NADH dehydrogenase 1 beta subcomplex subunit 10 [Lepeophtheirus salmonis]